MKSVSPARHTQPKSIMSKEVKSNLNLMFYDFNSEAKDKPINAYQDN
jgi:hypothetical protein